MPLMEILMTSFAGMSKGIDLVNHAAKAAAKPMIYYHEPPEPFETVLSRHIRTVQAGNPKPGPVCLGQYDRVPTEQLTPEPGPQLPPPSSQPDIGPGFLGIAMDMLKGEWIFKANARVVTSANKMMGVLFNLTEDSPKK